MPDIIVKQQPATSLTVQSNSTQLVIRQIAANNVTISTGGNSYVLPAATNSTLGGIIVGSNLTIANGVLSATSSGGGVTAFNSRTGNVTLTASDVTAVANGIYQANGSYLACATTALTIPSGSEQVTGLQANTSTYQIFSGTGAFGSAYLGVRSLSSNTAISYIQCDPRTVPFGKVTIYHNGATLTFNDRGLTAGSTANFTWGSNDFSTVGFNDVRYQNATNNTWANLTGKPTFATVATSGSYTDLANTPNLSLYYLANNPTGYITAACLTYGNITGTPNLSLYLTTANAATTYLPSANFTYANIGGTIPTATNSTLGAIKVGSNLTIANGVLSATSSGGFQNGDTLNGGTY